MARPRRWYAHAPMARPRTDGTPLSVFIRHPMPTAWQAPVHVAEWAGDPATAALNARLVSDHHPPVAIGFEDVCRAERQAWLGIARRADCQILDADVSILFIDVVFQTDNQIVDIDVWQLNVGDRRRLAIGSITHGLPSHCTH